MSLTPEQIGQVRQIARLRSFSEAQNLCAKLNTVEENQAVEYIAEWAQVARKFTKIDSNKGVKIDKGDYRLALINDMRRLLGLRELDSETEGVYGWGEICFSHPVEVGGCD